MEIPWKIFHEIPRGQKHKKLYGDFTEFRVQLPRNTTGLHGVFVRFAHVELPWKTSSSMAFMRESNNHYHGLHNEEISKQYKTRNTNIGLYFVHSLNIFVCRQIQSNFY